MPGRGLGGNRCQGGSLEDGCRCYIPTVKAKMEHQEDVSSMVVEAKSEQTISDDELRCLLFCKCHDGRGDCCHAAARHRLSRMEYTLPLDVEVRNSKDECVVYAEESLLDQDRLDDDWSRVPICRVQEEFVPTGTSWSEAKQALRHGSFEVIPFTFRQDRGIR